MKELNIGKRYGKLILLGDGGRKRFPSGQIKRLVDLKCDCGNNHKAILQKIENGETTSCGCWKREKPAVNKEVFNKGDQIGPFTFIKEAGYKKKKRRVEVQCFCGKVKETTAYVAKTSISCGCHRKSKRTTDHAARSRLSSSKRRAEIRTTSDGTITQKALDELMFLQMNKCNICDCNIENGYHIDHVQPLNDGGIHSIHNIQLLCADCNLKKSDGYDW